MVLTIMSSLLPKLTKLQATSGETYSGEVILSAALVTFSAYGGTSMLGRMLSSTIATLLELSLLALSVIRTWAFHLLIEQLKVEVYVACVIFFHPWLEISFVSQWPHPLCIYR